MQKIASLHNGSTAGYFHLKDKRQHALLDLLKKQGPSSREALANAMDGLGFPISRATLARDLNELINSGLVEKTGMARSTLYCPIATSKLAAPVDIDHYFSYPNETENPQKIYFNFNIFDDLKNIFSKKEIKKIDKLNSIYTENVKLFDEEKLKKSLENFIIEFSWKSSQIEGNTYSYIDSKKLITKNIMAKGKSEDEAHMIINHKNSIDFVLDNKDYFREISTFKIVELHRILTRNLNIESGIRKRIVSITGSRYKPLDNEFQIIDSMDKFVKIVNKAKHPVEKALLSSLLVSYIQPFMDGNKRTSRILTNTILIAYDFCPISYGTVNIDKYKKNLLLFYEENNFYHFKKLFIEQFESTIKRYFNNKMNL